MHVDTGHNFPEVIEFRDRRVAELGERLIVASVQDSIDSGRVVEETGPRASRNRLQTVTLLDAIDRAWLRRRLRRRPPRRGARPGQGADLLASATTSASGTPRRSGPSCGRSTTGAYAGASTCACSRSPTGPSSTSGATSTRSSSSCRRSTSRTSATFSSATACSTRRRRYVELLRRRGAVHDVGALPHGRRHELHRRVSSSAATLDAGGGRDRRHPDHRARRDPRRRPRHRGGDGGPQAGRVFLDAGRITNSATHGQPSDRAAARGHRGVGRRRQVHADRAPALRHQAGAEPTSSRTSRRSPSAAATAT